MTITLPWWSLPLALFVAGWGFCIIRESVRTHGDYDFDFLSPIVGLAGTIAAGGILVGRWIA